MAKQNVVTRKSPPFIRSAAAEESASSGVWGEKYILVFLWLRSMFNFHTTKPRRRIARGTLRSGNEHPSGSASATATMAHHTGAAVALLEKGGADPNALRKSGGLGALYWCWRYATSGEAQGLSVEKCRARKSESMRLAEALIRAGLDMVGVGLCVAVQKDHHGRRQGLITCSHSSTCLRLTSAV
jgi:hypothetical protein